ncbi:MAG TPA: thioredoxin family protein [Polyangiaceae bacterium]|jgi:thiol-disulfide isomerase/thioredoxin|nr:thioredoxin family protein [Polyangiaceae bacterium]
MLARPLTRSRSALWAPALATALFALGAAACNSRPRALAGSGAPGAGSASAIKRSSAKPGFSPRPRDGRPVEQFVQEQVERAETDGARVVVYVGASWCEPCRHFHEALEHGELDRALAGTRFLEFDADRDGRELRAAGYTSKYVPLFGIPDPDGRASGLMIEGSVKGPSAVAENLLPRLVALLDGRKVE